MVMKFLAANCLTDPPRQENGRIKSYLRNHNSKVDYECNQGYIEQTHSEVQCMFGSWTGFPPVCKISGCYVKDLKNIKGLHSIVRDPTEEGQLLELNCAAGYHWSNFKPRCLGGNWSDVTTPLCIQNDCPIVNIANGEFTELEMQDDWINGRITRTSQYKKVKMNTMIKADTTLYFFCLNGFIPDQGQRNPFPTTCTEGRWNPYPNCFKNSVGSSDNSPSPAGGVSSPSSTHVVGTSPMTSMSTSSYNRDFAAVSSEVPLISSTTPQPPDDCYCPYQVSENSKVEAYVENKLLQPREEVKRNTVVKFQCKHYGSMRLIGPTEILCTTCKPWHSSEFPDCVPPATGETILSFDRANIKVVPTDILQVKSGSTVEFLCYGHGITRFPTWKVSEVSTDNFDAKDEKMYAGTNIVSVSKLIIPKVNSLYRGKYECQYGNQRPKVFYLHVLGKLTMFNVIKNEDIEGDVLRVEQGKDVRIHCYGDQASSYPKWTSSVSDSFWSSREVSDGKSRFARLIIFNAQAYKEGVYSCKLDGHETRDLHLEVIVKCPKFEQHSQYFTQYERPRTVNSRAKFTCYNGREEKIVKCLSNGKWSGGPPNCSLKCSKFEEREEFSISYEEMQNNTYQAKFVCKNGEEKSLICLSNGNWSEEPPTCALKCSKFEENEAFLVSYEETQTQDSQAKIMCKNGKEKIVTCLSNGKWSEELPVCTSSSTSSFVASSTIKCPVLNNTEGFKVIYSNGLEVNSTATFHCLWPRIKTGKSQIYCKDNGHWSEVVPSCTLPNCSLLNLTKEIPPNLTANLRGAKTDSVPFKAEIVLTCKGNMTSIESSVAKCGINGVWEIPEIQCVSVTSSCKISDLSQEFSNIQPNITPVKEYYSFGESITLSCPPGHDFSKRVKTIMCMQHGWSESKLPVCNKKQT